MRFRKILMGTACCALTALSSMATVATFDWEEVPVQGWWLNGGYTEVNSGVTLVSSGEVFASNAAGNGAALKAAYVSNTNAGFFAMQEDGSATTFIVQSIDISANGGVPVEIFPTVQGALGGTVVWTITPTTSVGYATYTTASSGDMTASIDQIIWNTGQHSNPDATYNNGIDNLVVVTPGTYTPPEGSALFDWEEFDGNWWESASFTYSETNNGLVLLTSGRASGNSGGDGPGGTNGYAFKSDYAQDLVAGGYTVLDGGVVKYFVVNSIDIGAQGGGEYTPTVQGTAGGTVVWTIIPTEGVGLDTYTSATSGDMSIAIDAIVWKTGEAAVPGANYQNRLDNLSVEISEPPVFEEGVAIFDWEEFGTNWWQGYGYTETENGITMTSSGRATGSAGGDGPGGANGTAFKSDYAADLAAGTFTMSENGAATYFVVNSMGISANGLGEYTPTVQGTAGGAVVWTIIPTEGVGMQTYASATSGDMTAAIDAIVWNTGEAAVPGANYQNQIDNLSIQTADAPVFEEGMASFDWEEFAGNWWEIASFSYSETENGITMNASGRASASDGGDGAGGANGAAYKAAYAQDLDPGYITMQQAGEDVWFEVQSIDIQANGGTPSEFIPSVQGEADGVIQWEIIAQTNVGLITYTSATTGDLSLPIERIIWNTGEHSDPDNTSGNAIDNLTIKTSLPALEVIYDWQLGAFWTPHAVFGWNMPNLGIDLLNFDQYWWSGGDTTGTPTVIKHRPGLANLPDGGGFGGAPADINVGGFGNRGVWVTDPVRPLVTNETLRISYDWTMFVNGSDDGRFIDMFFSTTGSQSAKRFGQTGTELGFAWYQSAESNDVAITFAADDDWMSSTPPVLRIPLTGLGIDVDTADHDGDELAISYTAKKTTVANTWLCSIVVSNKATAASYSVENVSIVNAAAYSNPTYYCIYTADDLSDGDLTSGANPAGYEIDALRVAILLLPPPAAVGYDAYLEAYGMDDKPNNGPYEDFDADGMLNIYEYGWGGDPTNLNVQGILPEVTVSGGISYHTTLELKDPSSGINYEVLVTPNLVSIPWDAPEWSSVIPTSYDELYNSVQRGLDESFDQLFIKTTINTNSP